MSALIEHLNLASPVVKAVVVLLPHLSPPVIGARTQSVASAWLPASNYDEVDPCGCRRTSGDPHGGEVKDRNTVTDLNTETMKAYLAAVSKLLLGNAVLKPGVGITAGKPLDQLKKVELR